MPAAPRPSRTLRRPPGLGLLAENLGMLAVLLVMVVLFRLRSDHFFQASTFASLANEIPALMVIAVGMTFVLLIAGIDLSVGSVMGLGGAVLGVALIDWHCPIWAAVLLCLLVALACGLLNGSITVRWAIPSFIVTLGMLEIARGGTYLVTGSRTKYLGTLLRPVGAPLEGVGLSPAFFLALLVVVLGQFVLSRTMFGRHVIAVGSNEEAARLSGINPKRVKITVFALAGLLCGLGAWFHTSRFPAADPNAGIGLELTAIAAVVIGGTSLMGGRGSVLGSFFGVLIIALLDHGLASVGAKEPIKRVVTGSVIVLAAIADTYRHRLSVHDLLARWGLSRRRRE